MKKVAIFTTFFEATSGYSLISVTETQIESLLAHGYNPRVLVQALETKDCLDPDSDGKGFIAGFEELPAPSVWRREIIDLRPVIPGLRLNDGVSPHFEQRVDMIYQALEENLDGIDVCITHDIILQNGYKEHNVAMRRYARKRPDLLWLHWIHSCPTPKKGYKYPDDCRYTPPPGYIVYPNDSDKALVAGTYQLVNQEWRVKVCRAAHAIDPMKVWPYDGLTRDLVGSFNMLDGDVVAVYPARLDRGKHPEKILYLMAGIKRLGYVPKLLIVDWQSSGERFQKYIDELIELATELGIENDVAFTSRLDDRCSQGVPRRVVNELMDLSNVYIHPSAAETYSLTAHEAILRGNLAVLNHDFPAMRELYGDNILYMDFGSDRISRTYEPDERTFWQDESKRLMVELLQNRAIVAKTRARKEWSPNALWKTFEPLLYLDPVGE